MKPCQKPNGCEHRLRDVLPKGVRLTIFKIYKNGGIWRQVYEGNGSGLEGSE